MSSCPGLLLRNSITIRKAGDALEDVPGMLECDTVSHCGPTLQGEFARTLTMKEMRGDRHEHGLDRVRLHPGNASKWILEAVEELREEDIAFTRSRPYRKND